MNTKKVFVTVGTTKFPKLIDTITTKDVINTLMLLGYNFVQIQTGNAFSEINIDPAILPICKIKMENNSSVVQVGDKIKLKYDQYFENFEKEIESSDLVISHAGAGTCLEVLRKQKPLIVVVNEDLMNNHQTELAEQLQNDGYLYFGTCSTLSKILKKDISKLKLYPEPTKLLFSNYLDKCMGFVN